MGIIRLLLAIAVVIDHTTPIFGITMIGGQTAVHAFYILSGFYMSLILNEKYIKRNNSYRLFITNRLMRLYPVYWLVLVAAVLFAFFQHYYSIVAYANAYDFGQLSVFRLVYHQITPWTFLYFLFTNIFILGQDTLLFLKLTNTGGLSFAPSFTKLVLPLHEFLLIPQAWAVSLEIVFYFLAPLIVRRSLKVILILMCSSLVIRILLAKYGFNYDPWTYRFFPSEFIFFLLGNLSYRFYRRIEDKNMNLPNVVIIWISILLLTVIYKTAGSVQHTTIYLSFIALGIPYIFKLTKKWSIDRFLGELAYPLYISHYLILSIIFFLHLPLFGLTGAHVLLISLPFSVLLYEGIIRKIDNIRQQRLS